MDLVDSAIKERHRYKSIMRAVILRMLGAIIETQELRSQPPLRIEIPHTPSICYSLMRIFLIRHAETVDNVANVYAGARDSALTIHGGIQAQRLARFLTESGFRFNYIFSSDLERARKTADAICLAQLDKYGNNTERPLEVKLLSVLREQHFGSFEGKPFQSRSRNSIKDIKIGKTAQLQGAPEFQDVEQKESMELRTKAFLREHLVPIIRKAVGSETSTVAIVSHGIILSYLWRSFLRLLPINSVALSPDQVTGHGNSAALEFLCGWSNTGYLELSLQSDSDTSIDYTQPPTDSTSLTSFIDAQPETANVSFERLRNIRVMIKTINGKAHLIGLKRTRGGVGSSKQDDCQTTIESYFKKRKL